MSDVTIGGRTFSLTDVLIGMVVFAILFILVRFIQGFLDVRVLRQTRMDVGVRDALKAGIGYVGVVIAALVAIHTAGIDLSGLAIVAGALSVGIGFGMQSIVSNFVSGLILLIERPIKEGDWIVVGQDEGYVKRISVRSTEIQTFSNATVIVPNSELITGSVTNWMYKDKSGRAELPIGVAYGSDTAKVREVLLDCLKGHNGIRAWPQPTVLFMDFGDNALLFQLRFYVNKVDDRLSIASDIRFAIDAAFREAGISIPFPQRDVHVIEASGQPDETEVKPDKAATPQSSKILPIRSGGRADDSGIDQDSDD
jgi:small-conductance mechanosensitive channel